MRYAAVVIGRNEGERLKRCIASLSTAAVVIYVDSGSTDGSANWTKSHGVDTVALDPSKPFSAARGRNAGFARLLETLPDIDYVQFIDGDCELEPEWPRHAIDFLSAHPDVAVAWGRLRERFPGRSVYNWMCDLEWNRPAGETRGSGGIVMMRTSALSAVNGYRDDVIASEDDELCVRLRAVGWRIWKLEQEMALHDANITRFRQWWRRTSRGGYGFAQGAYLHGAPPERHWVWESRRAWIWGLVLPCTCLVATVLFWPLGAISFLIFPLQVLRLALRGSGPLADRVTLAFFQTLARFPEAWGQVMFTRDRLFLRVPRIIEYK